MGGKQEGPELRRPTPDTKKLQAEGSDGSSVQSALRGSRTLTPAPPMAHLRVNSLSGHVAVIGALQTIAAGWPLPGFPSKTW